MEVVGRLVELCQKRQTNNGAGTLTAGLVAGGWYDSNQADSEEYDGTAWTEGNNLNTARRYSGGFGTQTAALLAGG